MNRSVVLSLCILIAAAAPLFAFEAHVSQPASLRMSAEPTGCSNNPGPFVTLNGELSLGGISARLILTNNARFTHVTEADITADLAILDAGESIRIVKQPSRGGVGGNPHIYFQFSDCNDNALGSPAYLGRCVQGLSDTSLDFVLPTDVSLDVTSGSCANAPGPYVTLNGELRLGGLCGTLIFTNNARWTHVTEEDVTVDVVLLEEGQSLTFAKQPPLGGAGGNPWIYLQILDGDGLPTTNPVLVGRCNHLGN